MKGTCERCRAFMVLYFHEEYFIDVPVRIETRQSLQKNPVTNPEKSAKQYDLIINYK
jgi:hypothetical protein